MSGRKKHIIMGDEARTENLPLPVVLYPGHGAFLCFKSEDNSSICLCNCSRKAVDNYIKLKLIKRPLFSESRYSYILSAHDFPSALVQQLLDANVAEDLVIQHLQFKDKLCHKCNNALPSIRYMHEMYGGQFGQNYGWYINQEWYINGISRVWLNYLPDQCPTEMATIIIQIKNLQNQAETARAEWKASGDQAADVGFYSLSNTSEAIKFRRLILAQNPLKKKLADLVENLTRAELGYKNIGESWVSETMLFHLVQRLYPDLEVKHHYRPEWLGGLELDIFIPALKIGIEYQGEQHYRPMKHWGGEDSFAKLVERDRRKRVICSDEGIKLVEIKYDEYVNENNLLKKINSPSRKNKRK